MSIIPAAHWTTGVRALLDHIDEHQLSMPSEIAPAPASRFGGRGALEVRIAYVDMPDWLNSLTVVDEMAQVNDTDFGQYARLAWKAVLPAVGVRVDLLTSHQLDDQAVGA